MPTFQDVFNAISSRDLGQLNQLISGDNTLASSRNEAGVSALMTAAYHQNSGSSGWSGRLSDELISGFV